MKPLPKAAPTPKKPLTPEQQIRNNESVERACFKAQENFERGKKPNPTDTWESVGSDFQLKIGYIVEMYWRDYEIESNWYPENFKKKFKKTITNFKKIEEFIEWIPPRARDILNDRMISRSKKANNTANQIGKLLLYTKIMKYVLEKITEKPFVKKRKRCVERTCDKLWVIREGITGDDFKKNWDASYKYPPKEDEGSMSITASKKRQSKAPKRSTLTAFHGDDAAFVGDVLQAIDPTITLSAVGTALRQVATKRNASKKMKPIQPVM